MDIGVGDFVLCVEQDVSPCGQYATQVGAIYVVEKIYTFLPGRGIDGCSVHGDRCPLAGYDLQDMPAPQKQVWCSLCFVKAGKPGDFSSLLICEELEDA